MSLVNLLGVKGKVKRFVLSLVEMFLFGAITVAIFVVPALIYAAGNSEASRTSLDLSAGFAAMPWWLWTLLIAGYLALVTIYWAPSRDEEANAAEFWAFTVFFGLTMLALLLKSWSYVASLPFWQRAGG